MDQPLDLTVNPNKTPFTIEYLTSKHSHQKKHPPRLPLQTSLENQYYPLKKSIQTFQIVNGGHGIKNPLFDCATEALQIQHGMTDDHHLSLSHINLSFSKFKSSN